MALRPLPTVAYHPLRVLFLASFWLVSALAFFTRLERFSTLFSVVTVTCLALGVGVVLCVAALPAPGRTPVR